MNFEVTRLRKPVKFYVEKFSERVSVCDCTDDREWTDAELEWHREYSFKYQQ